MRGSNSRMGPPPDLVVVLPGIMGSTLRKDDRLVWAPSGGSVLRAIATFAESVKALELPDGIGDDDPGDGVTPVALMPDRHVLPGIWTLVRGYDRLLARLRSVGYRNVDQRPGAAPGNLLPVSYDWRLSCRRTGAWLGTVVEPALDRWRAQGGPYADAQLVFICHSMGGLVARWYIERCGGAAITRKLITLGTPYRGATKALEQLVNGVHRGIGSLAIDLSNFARSLPSLHQLLPEYACIERGADLAKTTEVTIPELRARDVDDAMRFHTELSDAEGQRPDSLTATHPILGTNQPTATTVQISGSRVVPRETYRGENLYGDTTVPVVGACRADVPMNSNTLRRVPDKHGNLHRNSAALDELAGILTAKAIQVRAPKEIELRVAAPEFLLAGEPLPLTVTVLDDTRIALRVAVLDETGHVVEARVVRATHGTAATTIEDLPPGSYGVDITGLDPTSAVAPVSNDVLIWA
jgi:pimeloyl-ACP methyl ester carboxylesterase